MHLGAIFPQNEFGNDPVAIRDWVQTAEGLGYDHVLAYDHVLGADPTNRPGWTGYNHRDPFHEIFVLFGYFAALSRVELVTDVLVLPQRQTALVAKQASAIDVLSGGRLRLGVGIGWNAVEYESLNEHFRNRAGRMEEQIAVLRALWTDPVVTFKGRWHTVIEAGLNPLPIQRPIPIWIGGTADAAIERIGRIGDGWFPQMGPNDTARAKLDILHTAAQAAGRDPASIGIEPRIAYGQVPDAEAAAMLAGWRDLGATHMSVGFMKSGFATPQEHIAALGRAKAVLG
ncbi:MAG: LLM class F420-dependent oxidoreductase [Thermomicrobiales bacterium]